MGIVESLIACAMLGAVALVMVTVVGQNRSSSVSLGSSSVCVTRVDSLISPFKNGDNHIIIDNWTTKSTANVPPAGVTHPERFRIPIIYNDTGTLPITLPMINTWELINNSTNWALALLNSDPAYCNGTVTLPGSHVLNAGKEISANEIFPGWTSSINPAGVQINSTEKAYLRIQPYDMSTSTALPCPAGPIKIAPLGTTNGAFAAQMGTTTALQIQGTIVYTDSSNLTRSCEAENILRPEGDTVVPRLVNYVVTPNCDPTGTICLAAPQVFTFPPNPPYVCKGSASADVYAAINEAGSMFLCQLNYSTNDIFPPLNPGKYVPCDKVTVNAGGTTVTATATYSAYNGGLGMDLKIGPGIKRGVYEIYIKGYDSAQNPSQDNRFTFRYDYQATNISVVPPPRMVNRFDPTGTILRGSTAIPPSFSSVANTAVFPNAYQCSQSLPTDQWSVLISPPGLGNKAQWNLNGALIPGGCQANVVIGALPTGNQSMLAKACDPCGNVQTVSDLFPWTSDFDPPPTPSHAGGPGFVTRPTYTLGMAKPSTRFSYSCEDATTFGTYLADPGQGSSVSCTPGNFPAGDSPCTDRGNLGFCTRAFDQCGRTAADAPTTYSVLAGLGQSCGNVACHPGLICGLDSPTKGRCVAAAGCSVDADCGGFPNICFTGTCHGSSSGPAVGGPGAPVCPNLNSSCGGLTAPPVCIPSCSAATAAATCYNKSFSDSCGNAGACAGAKPCATPSPGVSPPPPPPPPPTPAPSPTPPGVSPTPTPANLPQPIYVMTMGAPGIISCNPGDVALGGWARPRNWRRYVDYPAGSNGWQCYSNDGTLQTCGVICLSMPAGPRAIDTTDVYQVSGAGAASCGPGDYLVGCGYNIGGNFSQDNNGMYSVPSGNSCTCGRQASGGITCMGVCINGASVTAKGYNAATKFSSFSYDPGNTTLGTAGCPSGQPVGGGVRPGNWNGISGEPGGGAWDCLGERQGLGITDCDVQCMIPP